MTETIETSRIEVLILARLWAKGAKKPALSDIKKALSPLLLVTPGELTEIVTVALSRLENDEAISSKPYTMTAVGEKRLSRFLGLSPLPSFSWAELKRIYLSALALGIEITAENKKRLKDADVLRAAILSKHHGLELRATPTFNEAIDAMVWRELGLEPSGRLTLNKVRRLALGKVLGREPPKDTTRTKRLVVATSVGAKGTDTQSVHKALLRKWLTGEPAEQEPAREEPQVEENPEPEPQEPELEPALESQPEPSAERSDPELEEPEPPESGAPELEVSPEFELSAFARAVDATAHQNGVSRYGDHKVFISSIWEHLKDNPTCTGMDLEAFKSHLIEANQKGLLRLNRADLVGAMDSHDVSESETRYLNAIFHFVRIDEGQ